MAQTIPARDRLRLVEGSGGSFLCPPGHPMHRYHAESGPRNNPNAIVSLDYVLGTGSDEGPAYGATTSLVERVRKLYADATLVMTEDWVISVYGYFRNCYAPEDGSRNVSDAVFLKPGDEPLPPERHRGYLCVRDYSPDAEPRLDLIESGGFWGKKSCAKCGRGLQYDAGVDDWIDAEAVRHRVQECPEGGKHEVTR